MLILLRYLEDNDAWVREMAAVKGPTDDYWLAVGQASRSVFSAQNKRQDLC